MGLRPGCRRTETTNVVDVLNPVEKSCPFMYFPLSMHSTYRYFSVQFKIQRLWLTEKPRSDFISAEVAVKRCSQDLNFSANEAELRPILVKNAAGSWMSPITNSVQ